MEKHSKNKEYLTRLEMAAGHRKFGVVSARKEPKEEDDEGGVGSRGYEPPAFLQAHPLLASAVQFSGDFDQESPLINENPNAEKELQNRHEAKLDKKLQAEKHFNPTPSPMR